MQKEERDEKLKDKAYKERQKKLSKNLKPSTPSTAASHAINFMMKSPSPINRPRTDSRMKRQRPSSAKGLGSREDDLTAEFELPDIHSGFTRRRSKTFSDGFDIKVDTSSTFLLPPIVSSPTP